MFRGRAIAFLPFAQRVEQLARFAIIGRMDQSFAETALGRRRIPERVVHMAQQSMGLRRVGVDRHGLAEHVSRFAPELRPRKGRAKAKVGIRAPRRETQGLVKVRARAPTYLVRP